MSFRPTFCRLAKKSSRQWLARQTKDPYVKKRQIDPAAFRARSAFKLLEINDQWDNFLSKSDVNAVVDLGAAPGGWSQVVAQKLGWTSESTDSSPTHDSASTFDPLAIDDDISAPVQGRGSSKSSSNEKGSTTERST
ncbi:RNA methyltransferase [Coprinopsis cinerea AmutBmut pab1-1]|nr:RNA methyltransferase [Coprinopsis cinerea AmutBmut pab1-1]